MGCLKIPYDQGEWTIKSSPLKICRGIEKNPVSSFFCVDNIPFGLAFNSYVSGVKNDYLYNQGSKTTFQGLEGKEFKTERQPELQVDMSRYRTYDFALGRWWQVDPLADSMQWQSPYSGMDNNPIRYNDPEGDCPTCIIGAIIGGATEYAAQVTGNIIKNGGEFTVDAFTDVDVYDIGVSAVVGAVTQGASAFTKGAITVAAEVTKATIDVNTTENGVEIQTVIDDKSVTDAAVDLGAGLVSLPINGSVTKEAVGATQKAVGEVVESGLEVLTSVPAEPIKEAIGGN